MGIYEKIIEKYPELKNSDEFIYGSIRLRDDGDGIVYIDKWDYEKPLPESLHLGK